MALHAGRALEHVEHALVLVLWLLGRLLWLLLLCLGLLAGVRRAAVWFLGLVFLARVGWSAVLLVLVVFVWLAAVGILPAIGRARMWVTGVRRGVGGRVGAGVLLFFFDARERDASVEGGVAARIGARTRGRTGSDGSAASAPPSSRPALRR